MDNFQLGGADHLDLLVSAATAYGQLTNLTTATFSRAPAAAFTTAFPDEAGQLLLEENLAAARWRSHRGRGQLPAGHLMTYRYRPVEDWEPVEVIKAVHAYSHATADSPGWAGSAAHRLTADVAHSAAQHLPGYAETPWSWRRPAAPAGPIGLHDTWCPDVAGITWVELAELLEGWPDTLGQVLLVKLPTAAAWLQQRLQPAGAELEDT